MRLIDADALPTVVGTQAELPGLIVKAIWDMPTIDAVPVVRCRDCEWHDGVRCFRWNSVIVTGFDDFCSEGERKDDV